MHKKMAILVGFIGKLPYAGMTLFNIHYIAGLQELGYGVYYVEAQDYPDQFYDLAADTMTSDPTYAVRYLREMLPRYRVSDEQFSLIDLEHRCHGAGWTTLRSALHRADFLLTIGTPSWLDEFVLCSRRAFVDIDPVFTQAEMLGGGLKASVLRNYDSLFTSGTRIGKPDCTIPDVGRHWIPTRTVIATRLWDIAPPCNGSAPVTALLHWAAGDEVIISGRKYGHKNREFQRFVELPQLTSQPFAVAIGGCPLKDKLESLGWTLVSPLRVTGTIEDYRDFINGSHADFGIAKHAYVASRSGWFSDRSTCYLASGRPVLHQDTGFSEWLPTGDGVLAFSDIGDVLECLRCFDLDYVRHAAAARRIAEDHFEARSVIAQMLDDAGFR